MIYIAIRLLFYALFITAVCLLKIRKDTSARALRYVIFTGFAALVAEMFINYTFGAVSYIFVNASNLFSVLSVVLSVSVIFGATLLITKLFKITHMHAIYPIVFGACVILASFVMAAECRKLAETLYYDNLLYILAAQKEVKKYTLFREILYLIPSLVYAVGVIIIQKRQISKKR